jgi:predicted permease
MTRLARIVGHRFRSLFHRSKSETDLQREVEMHIEQLIREYMDAGMTESEARLSARRQFGSIQATKEQCRDMRRINWIEEVLKDLRYALRIWVKSPGFTAVALISLAVGIGGNTAIFSLVDAILLRTLPVPQPQQLLEVSRPGGGTLSYPMYEIIRDRNQVFSDVLVTSGGRLTAGARFGEADVHDIHVSPVSTNYFRVLGLSPVIGRDFSEDDSGASGAGIISYGLWQRVLASDPAVLGKAVRIGERVYTIVGVAPPKFTGITTGQPVDLWIPITWINKEARSNPVAMMFRVMARRRASESEEQVRANMDLLAAQWSGDWRFESPMKVEVAPAAGGLTQLRRRFSSPLLVLMTIVASLLLIAATNVGSLLLARASARQKEMAVRLSLGASRRRLIRQLLTESILLGVAGGLLGLLLAPATAAFLVRFLSSAVAGVELSFGIDARMLAFTFSASIIVVLVFGLAPALVATRLDLSPIFKGGASTASGKAGTPGKLLILAEVCVSCVLLVGGVLFARSLQSLTNLDAGFRRENVLLLGLYTRGQGPSYPMFQSILDRLSRIPGVEAASLSSEALFSGNTWTEAVNAPGFAPRRGADREAVMLVVAPGFFRTMGTAVLRGRDFDERDGEHSPRVAIVNEAMARYYLNATDVLGKTFHIEHRDFPEPLTVVGIVQDAKYRNLRDAAPRMVYLPLQQNPGASGDATIAVRTADEPDTMAGLLVKETESESPGVRVGSVTTQARLVNGTIAADRMLAQIAGFFALTAILLVSVGLYGLTAFEVSRRTREIGVRIALGAQYLDVLQMVLRRSMGVVGIGVVLGVAASLALARVIESLLFGVTGADPISMFLSAAMLLGVGAAAAYLPARRAARLDPITSIKYE